MPRTLATVLFLLAATAGAARAEDDAPPQADIDAAVARGADFLQRKARVSARESELVAFTLLHAGVAGDDASVAPRVARAASEPIAATYRIALAAMLLEAADREKYRLRIAELAQKLCDEQSQNGQWSYGERTRDDEDEPEGPVTTGDPKRDAPQPPAPPKAGKTEARKHVKLRWNGPKGPPAGDNSNTQFALLGLRAAEDASVEVPLETWALSRKWFEGDVRPDGGFGYSILYFPGRGGGGGGGGGQRGGGGGGFGGNGKDPSYGSMTAVGVASLALCDNYLKRDVKKEPAFASGVAWLGKKLTFEENPDDQRGDGRGMGRHYYWIYSVERAGVFAKLDKLGAHAWYAEGARWLLAHQNDDGGWNRLTVDTCFAILFLKRATAPLRPRVYTPG
jgi:hypothetical protein